MLRKLILVGAFAGTSASLPILYQSNPEAFDGLMRGTLAGSESAAPPPLAATLRTANDGTSERQAGRKVRLTADARGHFTADFRINGRPVDAMIDTGATVVAINQSTARRIGLNLSASDFSHRVQTANGEARAAAAMIERIEIGRIEVRDVQAVVLEDKALSGTLVGMTFLSRLRRYQVEAGGLTLEQ